MVGATVVAVIIFKMHVGYPRDIIMFPANLFALSQELLQIKKKVRIPLVECNKRLYSPDVKM